MIQMMKQTKNGGQPGNANGIRQKHNLATQGLKNSLSKNPGNKNSKPVKKNTPGY